MISQRARTIFSKPSTIFASHAIVASSPYHAATNPGGYINLGTSENRLIWDLLKPQIELAVRQSVQEDDSHYSNIFGIDPLRRAVAELFEQYFDAPATSNNVVVANGATAILNMVAFALCDEGEGVIIPSPYYSGFDVDLNGRARVQIVPANTASQDGFRVTGDCLEHAWHESVRAGVKVRAVILASPHNPLGRILSEAEIDAVVDFCKTKNIHCVVDEIYALSSFPGVKHPSVLPSIVAKKPGYENVHLIYGFSKDFALAGYRLGIFYSEHPDLQVAMKSLCYFNNVSAHTQRVLSFLLSDSEWMNHYFSENSRRLKEAFDLLCQNFDGLADVSTANAGFVAWLDFRQHLKDQTFDAETALHRMFLHEAKVSLLPGSSFHCSEPGFFRATFSQGLEPVRLGAERIRKFLRKD